MLYALSRDEELNPSETIAIYGNGIQNCFRLFLFNLFVIKEITKSAQSEEKRRKSKHLKSEADISFTADLYNNDLIQSLESNETLSKRFEDLEFSAKLPDGFIEKLYKTFRQEEEYEAYITKETLTKEDNIQVLLALFRHCRKDDYYNEIMEDHFTNWVDDKSLIIGALKKAIKSLPAEGKFYEEYYPDKETTEEFGRTLLKEAIDQEKDLLSIIEPTLKNWDADRVAIIDMILIKMALVEFSEFATIPTKVTLNEYVDISKLYSTPKSKDFINGILDRLLKLYEKEGKIKKEGRGLVD